MLCACCSSASSRLGDSNWNFFPSRLPSGQLYKFRFEANPIWYSAIKFMKSRHSAKCSLHKWAWLRCSIKVSLFEVYKFDRAILSPHCGLILRELMHSYALGCLWVFKVCCNTVGQHGQSFLSTPHAYTFNEQSKMATALTPQTDVMTSEKVTWLMENPRKYSLQK